LTGSLLWAVSNWYGLVPFALLLAACVPLWLTGEARDRKAKNPLHGCLDFKSEAALLAYRQRRRPNRRLRLFRRFAWLWVRRG
jgi:hypothetical protein